MRRQLRRNGGIMNAVPRQGYISGGIGGGIIQGTPMGSRTGYFNPFKAVGKAVGKVLDVGKQIVKSPVGRAALIGLGGAGLMGMGPLSGLSGIGARIGGSGIGQFFRGMGPKLFGTAAGTSAGPFSYLQKGVTPFTQGILGKLGLTKGGGSMIPTALGMISSASLLGYFVQKGATEEEAKELAQDVYRGKGLGMDQIRADMQKYRSGALSASQAYDKGYHFLTPQTYLGAQGGRVGLYAGTQKKKKKKTESKAPGPHKKTDKEVLKELYPTLFSDTTTSIEGSPKKKKYTKGKAQGGRIGYQEGAQIDPGSGSGSGEPNWPGGGFISTPDLDIGKNKLYKSPEGHYEFYDPDTGEYTSVGSDYDQLKNLYPIKGGSLGSRIRPAVSQVAPESPSGGQAPRGLGAIIMEARNRAATPEAPASVSMGQTLKQNIAANQAQQIRNQAILETGRQRLPTKRAFNVMMDPKGNVMKDQSMAEYFRDIGFNPERDYPVNSMADLMRPLGPSEGIGVRSDYNWPGEPDLPIGTVSPAAVTPAAVTPAAVTPITPMPIGLMPPMSNEFATDPGYFANPNVSAANPGGYASEQEAIADLGLQRYNELYAKGGRIGRFGGGIGVGMPRIPTGMPRVNAGGIRELDYRQEGGYVPMGVKEKADDVPAMLSKNEFVMTADAVKGAGGGSVEKGAQRMYDTMKRLENRIA